MGQQYPHFTRWEKNIVEILHIYGARAILLLFYNNQDTEYKSHEIEIIVSWPISNQTHTKGSMVQQYTYSTVWEQNIVGIMFIYGARAIFLLFCYHKDIESESSEIEMSISQPIFNHENISKAVWDNGIHSLKYGRKIQ